MEGKSRERSLNVLIIKRYFGL